MLLKPRPIPLELKIFRVLNTRMHLSDDDKQYYSNKEKGYEGEVLFDSMTAKLENENLILNDLLLKSHNTFFQIDSLIVFEKRIYLCDVKNFEGDYCYKSDGGFYSLSGTPYKDPLVQLKRCDSLLRELLHKHRFNCPIEAYLVYVNPEFTLYQPSVNPQIILPTQVNRFMKKLNMIPSSKLSMTHTKLAELLISLHQTENPYINLPKYTFDDLRKGPACKTCNSFSLMVGRTKLTCCECGRQEDIESAVLRMVEEIKLLFPEMKITTNLVHDWCKMIESKKMIRRILKKHFRSIGNTKEVYYVDDEHS